MIRMAVLSGAGGVTNEPALSICNDVLQTLLSAPNNWKFNKKALPQFTTIPYQQDYVVSGCTMSVPGKAVVYLNAVQSATPGLTESGTTATATFSDFAPNGIQGASPGGQPQLFAIGDQATIAGANQTTYNATFTLTSVPNTTSVQFTAAGGLVNDGGQGIGDICWIEHATLQDYMSTSTVKPLHDIEVVSSLPNESIIQPPFKVAMQIENSAGTLVTPLFRFWPVPSSQIWNALIFYQLVAPLKVALTDTWSPWPDTLGYVLRSGVKAKCYEFYEDPRFPTAYSLWQTDILRALDIRQQEARNESYFPDLPIMRGG